MTTARTPHVHAEVIKAWADGASIQYKGPRMTEWADLLSAGESMTQWRADVQYRVAPDPLTFYVALRRSMFNPDKFVVSSAQVSDLQSTSAEASWNLKLYKIVVDPTTKEPISFESVPGDTVTNQ